MPGIRVTTNVRSGANTALPAPSGQLFLVGQSERGSTTAPTRLRSAVDVDKYLGGRVTYSDIYDQLQTFFSEGGEQAYFTRVVGTTPTVGTLNLVDRAGSPVNTLRFDAASPGAWSSALTVQVANGPVTNTFNITVRLNGETVEEYIGVATPAEAASKFAASIYVKVTNLGSVTAAPGNNPAVMAATPLSSGTDDRGTVVAANYVTGLAQFTEDYGDGAVAIPGQTGATVWNGLIAHASTYKRIALLGAAKTETTTNLQSQAATLNSEWAGLFAPWVVVPVAGGLTRTISPEGYVAAKRALAHTQVGAWRVPAGQLAVATYVTGVDQTFTAPQSEELDAAKVNVIRVLANTVRLYGWRSLSNDFENYGYLKNRDLLNRLTYEAQARLQRFIFEPVDSKGHLLSSVNAELVGMLDPIAQASGLYGRYDENGDEIDPGYVVNTGTDINTPTSLSQNKVNAQIGVRVSPVGAWIDLVITQVGLLNAL